MKLIEEMRDKLVAAIDSQRILRQIVRTDGKKIAAACKMLCTKGCGRHFDHDADGHLLVKYFALCTEIILRTLDDSKCNVKFMRRRNHRQHHSHIAHSRCPENRTYLLGEH